MPEVKPIMRAAPWDAEFDMPWQQIKSIWDRHWDQRKRYLVEKSPPNLIRTDRIRYHFQPVRFVIMVREPRAHAEGLMRRNGWDATRSAALAMRTLRVQMQNAVNLPDSIAFTYEALTASPVAIAARIEAFLPGIAPLDVHRHFTIHSVDGTIDRPIVNLNDRKMALLSPEDLAEVEKVVSRHEDVLEYWGYAGGRVP